MKCSTKIIVQFLFTVLFPFVLFCQTEFLPTRTQPEHQSVFASRTGYDVYMTNYGPQHAMGKVGADSWASGGTGVVEQGGSGAVFTNPACMDFHSLTISADVSARLKTKSIYDYDYDYDNQFYPSFVSIGTSKEQWNISAGYFKYYTFRTNVSLGEATPTYPEGTGNYLNHEQNTSVHTLFGSANHTSKHFSYGLTMGLNYLNTEYTLLYASGHTFGLMAVAGLLVKPNEEINLGLSFKYVAPTDYSASVRDENSIYHASFPWQIEFGLGCNVTQNFHLLTSVDFQNWREVSEINKNVLQYHLGAILKLSEYNNFRLGFFTQNDPSQYIGKYFNQNFLTGGFQIGDKNISLTLSILDSHLFNGEEFWSSSENKKVQFHQSIISLGGTYMFE